MLKNNYLAAPQKTKVYIFLYFSNITKSDTFNLLTYETFIFKKKLKILSGIPFLRRLNTKRIIKEY